MSVKFDLEQRIMECWMVVDDIRVVYRRHLDGEEPLTEDELANILIGMEHMYDLKFYNLMSTYEKLLKEIYESKVHDNSQVLRQEESTPVSGY